MFMLEQRAVFCVLVVFGLVLIIGCDTGESRAPLVRSVHSALIMYAHDHQGWLPNSEKGALDGLQKLYPEYCPSGRELAGLSGDIDGVVRNLQSGQPLTEKLTSWVYVPGLKDTDNPNLAVLWEAKAGIHPNGKRDPTGARVVILLGGDITNISAADWEGFLKKQEQLRAAGTNSPPQARR